MQIPIPDLESADGPTQAAWAAVHEARRGLSVAWVSTVVNAIVVIVALYSPYIQAAIEAKNQEKSYAEIKSYFIKLAREQVTSIQKLKHEGSSLDEFEKTILRDRKVDSQAIKTSIEDIYQRINSDKQYLNSTADRFSPDLAIREGFGELIDPFDTVLSRISLLKSEIGMHEVNGADLVSEHHISMEQDLNEDQTDIEKIITDNTDQKGKIKGGKLIIDIQIK
jgi:phenylalanyl-tRNA synthetase alpha subunit